MFSKIGATVCNKYHVQLQKIIFAATKSQKLWLFICCKTMLKKKNFFWENICFLQNIRYLQKKCFYMEKKSFILKFFLLKKTFFTEKNVNENVKIYLIWEVYFYAENAWVSNKISIFLKYIFILQKKFFLIIKNIFVKTSLWTQ